jgi:hypothetical protein
MARPTKQGLNYFPLDVDVFTDTKIKVVRGNYGNDGVVLYFYLLCSIYKSGYYLKYDDDLQYVISADLGMTTDKIGQMLSFFLKRSLFDDTLFKADKILTSEGIQRRFQEAVKQRALKNPVQVEARFWVLKKDETQSFIKVHPDDSYSENNGDYSRNNWGFSENNPHKVKESKVKESKVKCSTPQAAHNDTITYGKYVHLTKADYDSLVNDYGEKQINDYIEKVDRYIENSGKKPYGNHCSTIRQWLEKDKVTKKTEHSYDLEKLLNHAINNIPVIDDGK